VSTGPELLNAHDDNNDKSVSAADSANNIGPPSGSVDHREDGSLADSDLRSSTYTAASNACNRLRDSSSTDIDASKNIAKPAIDAEGSLADSSADGQANKGIIVLEEGEMARFIFHAAGHCGKLECLLGVLKKHQIIVPDELLRGCTGDNNGDDEKQEASVDLQLNDRGPTFRLARGALGRELSDAARDSRQRFEEKHSISGTDSEGKQAAWKWHNSDAINIFDSSNIFSFVTERENEEEDTGV
jgi:hypothetical protein